MIVPSFIKKQTIAGAALLIALINFLSKFVGFAREMLVANYFGATGRLMFF
jgi:peptidoglycan biosynthesis protein MviN/MurJ (putative lipid II flippase)